MLIDQRVTTGQKQPTAIVFVIAILSVFAGPTTVSLRKPNSSISCKAVSFSSKAMDNNFRSVCEFSESIIYNSSGS